MTTSNVGSSTSSRATQIQQAWQAYLDALQESQGRRTAEVRLAENRYQAVTRDYRSITGDAGNPGGQTPVTTQQAARLQIPPDLAALMKSTGNETNIPHGVQPVTARAAQAARDLGFRGVIGGLGERKNKSDHPHGLALDLMTKDQGVGDALRDFYIQNAKALGVTYVIWDRKIYNAPGFEPEPYNGESPHTDHVHVSFAGDGSGGPLEAPGGSYEGGTATSGGGGVSAGGGGGSVSSSGGGGGRPSGGGGSVEQPSPNGPTGNEPPTPSGGDFFAKILASLMELTDEQRRVLSKALGKNSEFAKYGQQRLGANFDPKNPPAWLVLEFVEKKLGALADSPEGAALLGELSKLEGAELGEAVGALLNRLDQGPPGQLPSLADLTGDPNRRPSA